MSRVTTEPLHNAKLASLMPALMLTLLFALFTQLVIAGEPEQPTPHDGQVMKKEDGSFVAWDAETELWLEPLLFWESFAARQGGLSYGWNHEYPPYEQAREHDTIMIQLDSGPCLMEFFHQRWRRSNDVHRWDPLFNEFGGCADVFK